MSTGCSKKSLAEKLGIREGLRMFFVNAPEGFDKTLGKLPRSVVLVKVLKDSLDFIHFFTKSRVKLESEFPILKQKLSWNGALWVSWPKGKSKLETDLNENVVREIGLKNGLVDVKVVAVDETWSGLKFVYRIEDRN